MDVFELPEAKQSPRRKRSRGRVWNILTILVFVAMVCILSYYALIFLNPNSSLNPFPPPTLNPALFTPTASVTPRYTLVPSWTPTQPAPMITAPQAPSETPIPPTAIVENPTSVPGGIALAANEYAFELQQGSPSAIPAAQFHQSAGCDWTGVAGQATSLNGEAVRGLFVEVGGSIPGDEQVGNLVMTGLAPQYGPGGFEITLANRLVASTGTLWVQLLDQQNLPLSDRVYFDTYDDCERNLVIVYFNQVR